MPLHWRVALIISCVNLHVSWQYLLPFRRQDLSEGQSLARILALWQCCAILCSGIFIFFLCHSSLHIPITGLHTSILIVEPVYTGVSSLSVASPECLLSNQYIFPNSMLGSSTFFLTCSFQRSLTSRFMLRYFDVLPGWRCMSLMKIGTLSVLLSMKSWYMSVSVWIKTR